MLKAEKTKAISNLRASWGKWSPGSPDECAWVEVLIDLHVGNTILKELEGLRLDAPPSRHVWNYTSGEAARKPVHVGGELQRIKDEYDWLVEDLVAASVITAYRSRDLIEAWLCTTGGRRVGTLAGAALARSLFEFGTEGVRASGEITDSLVSAPAEEAGLAVTIADGIWITLFRVLGGEKTKIVTPRENTRNVLGNMKWLRTGSTTTILSDDYDLLSEFLHSGGRTGFETTARQVEQAELNLLVAGAQTTLKAYQSFRRGAGAATALRDRTERLTVIDRIVGIGRLKALESLPIWQRAT